MNEKEKQILFLFVFILLLIFFIIFLNEKIESSIPAIMPGFLLTEVSRTFVSEYFATRRFKCHARDTLCN